MALTFKIIMWSYIKNEGKNLKYPIFTPCPEFSLIVNF